MSNHPLPFLFPLIQFLDSPSLSLVGNESEALKGALSQFGLGVSEPPVGDLPLVIAESQRTLELVEQHCSGGHSKLAVLARSETKVEIERLLIEAGYRKDPLYLRLASYNVLDDSSQSYFLGFEKIEAGFLSKFPLEVLKEERDLHMDMFREAGRRSDAHLARYHLAASLVREGDTVVDGACGLGYGSRILHRLGRRVTVTGYDLSDYAVEYAGQAYPHCKFEVRDLSNFEWLEDNSVDFIASFETLEHLQDPESFLKDALRILRPGGRIIVSVPCNWVDETGNDPNPYHFHVYDFAKAKEQMGRYFMVEQAFGQNAGGGMKNHDSTCEIHSLNLDTEPSQEPEWILLVGFKPTADATTVPYVETTFVGDPLPSSLDFAGAYANPWLIRGIVSNGRLVNNDLLSEEARQVLQMAAQESVDYGAALCVLLYREIGKPDPNKELLDRANAYQIVAENGNSHILRWKISIAYAVGALELNRGNVPAAKQWFEKVRNIDARPFCPLLGTKTVGACLQLAKIALDANQPSLALDEFRNGLRLTTELVGSDWPNTIGNPEHPAEFGMRELAEVVLMGQACVLGIQSLSAIPPRLGEAWAALAHLSNQSRWIKNPEFAAFERDQDQKSIAYHREKAAELLELVHQGNLTEERLTQRVDELSRELHALQNSKTMRILRPLRAIYGKLRGRK